MPLPHEVHGILWRVHNAATRQALHNALEEWERANRTLTRLMLTGAHKTRRPGWLPLAAVAACLLVVVALTAQAEMAYWDSIKVKEFPGGRFAALARAQMAALKAPPSPAPPPPAPVAAPKTAPEKLPVPAPVAPPKTAPQKPLPQAKQAEPVATKPPEVQPQATAPAKVQEPPAPVRQLPPGEVKVNPNDGQRYAWIPAGTFRMGCSSGDSQCYDDESPPHTVTITRGFWMGQTEVTVGAYQRFAQATGKSMHPVPSFRQDESHPVVIVTWHDAAAYCQWAGGRLPTEAEWEYAARAGTTGPYYGELDAIAWHLGNSARQTHPVGQKGPNAFRLYDIFGNLWEWVADWYGDKYYAGSEARDPQGPPGGKGRVLRGGSWVNSPRVLRASYRYWDEPGLRFSDLGCRCVREVIP